MEEAEARHIEVFHYSALAGIQVGWYPSPDVGKNDILRSVFLESFSGLRLKKKETDPAEKRV